MSNTTSHEGPEPAASRLLPALSRRQFLAGGMSLGLGLTAVAAGCGTTSNSPSSTKQTATAKVTILIDVAPYGKHAPFYVAKDKGSWSKRGLDVTIQWGNGSTDVLTKIASGAGQFGFVDASALILGRGNNGIQAKLVSMYHYKNLMSAMSLTTSGVRAPKDMLGKTFATEAGDADTLVLPALGQINHFDSTQVKINYTQFTSVVSAVISKQADGTLNYITLYPALQAAAAQAKTQVTSFLYADYGLDVYNNGIVVMDSYLKKSPDVVRAVNDGLTEGVIYAAAHPGDAVDILQKYVPAVSSDVLKAQLNIALQHMDVPEVRANGFGPMDEGKMKRTLELVNKYFKPKQPITDMTQIYTNSYVSGKKIPKLS